MIAFVEGEITELTPTNVIIKTAGVGYNIAISVNTYSEMLGKQKERLLTYHYIREDIQALYGFLHQTEKDLFTQLISVSGIGPNTARMMFSSLTASDIIAAINSNNVNTIKSIKGIGPKTAQRVILELKDKVNKIDLSSDAKQPIIHHQVKNESLSALLMLGFPKNDSEKIINKIVSDNPNITVEELIKQALKNL